jgi:SulP family sulfate permease
VRDTVRQTLVKAGVDRLIGDDHICPHISKAVVMANRIVREKEADRTAV